MRILAALLSLALVASSACAQYEHIFFPRISQADFLSMAEALPNDALPLAQAVFHRFDQDSRASIDGMVARARRFERGESTDDWDSLSVDWWLKRNELEARLGADVSALLQSDDARAVWARAYADDRRRMLLHQLKIELRQREQYDPLLALEAVDLSAEEAARIAPAIDAFVPAFDAALAAWQIVQVDYVRFRRTIPEDAPDRAARFTAMNDRWTASLRSITIVSESARAAIAEALDPDHREAYLAHIDKQVFPEAFVPCPAELFAVELRYAPGIAPEKRDAVEAIYADYVPARDAIRHQILTTIKRYKSGDHPLRRELDALTPKVERGEIDHQESYAVYQEISRRHPANPLLEQRHALALAAARRMRAIFDDSELASLPPALRLTLTPW